MQYCNRYFQWSRCQMFERSLENPSWYTTGSYSFCCEIWQYCLHPPGFSLPVSRIRKLQLLSLAFSAPLYKLPLIWGRRPFKCCTAVHCTVLRPIIISPYFCLAGKTLIEGLFSIWVDVIFIRVDFISIWVVFFLNPGEVKQIIFARDWDWLFLIQWLLLKYKIQAEVKMPALKDMRFKD